MSFQERRFQSLKLGVAVQAMPLVLGHGVNLLTTPYILSKIGLQNFGIWTIVSTLAYYASIFDFGTSSAVRRYVAVYHALSDKKNERAVIGLAVTVAMCVGFTLSGLVFIFAAALDRVLRTQDVHLARLLGLCATAILVTTMLSRSLAAVSVGRGRYVAGSFGLTTALLMQFSGGTLAVIMNPSLLSYAQGTVIGAILGFAGVMLIVLIDGGNFAIGIPNRHLFRDISRFVSATLISSVGDLLLMQSGKLITGLTLGPAAAGIYEIATRLAIGAQLLGVTSTNVLVPHITRAYVNGGMLQAVAQYEHLTRRNTSVALFPPFAIAATAYSAIPLWLNYTDATILWLLLAMLPGIAVNVSTAVCSSTLLATRRPGLIVIPSVIAGLLQFFFTIIMVHGYGLHGAALAFGMGISVFQLAGLWFMQSRIGIPMPQYLRAVAGPFVVATISALAPFGINLIAAPTNRSSALVPFIASLALFAITYLLLGWRVGCLPKFARNSAQSAKRWM